MNISERKRLERLAVLDSLGVHACIGQYQGQIVLDAGQADKLIKLLKRLPREPERAGEEAK